MASKSLGVLTLDLVARVGGFVQGMDAAERKSEKWRKKVEKDAAAAGKAIGAASVVVAGAMAVWIKSSINAAAELENLTRTANASTTEFQKYAAGTRTVGIENEKLADILKDVTDRVGDFLVTGGGPMADFFEKVAPKVGVTAEQFRNLSGPQALGLFVDSLEKAGANTEEMTFFLEQMASDSSKLIPLLKDGGKEMNRLAGEAENLGLILSEDAIKQAKEFNDNLDVLGQIAGSVGQQVAAELLPELVSLTEELKDPATAEAAAKMAKAVVGSFTSIINGARNTVNFIEWAAESAAAFMNGIAADDVVRLADEIERLEGMKNGFIEDRLVFFGRDGLVSYYNDEELDAELAKLRAAYEMAMSGTKITVPVAPEMVNTPAPGLGIDLDPPKPGKPAKPSRTPGRTNAGASAVDAAAEAQREYLALVERVTSVVESSWDDQAQAMQAYQEQVAVLREGLYAGVLNEDQYEMAVGALELRNELFTEKNEELLEENAGFWEQYLEAAETSMMDFDQLTADVLEQFSSRFGSAFESMIFDAESLGEAVGGMAEGMARSVVNAIGQMIAQWLAYQAVQLLTGKTAQASGAAALSANASAMSVQAALAAFASTAAIPIVGPALAPGAAAAATAVTGPMAAAVSSLALAGMAHDGIDAVPATGTWLLEKGERVMTSQTSAKMDKTLDKVSSGSSAPIVNLIEDASRAGRSESRQGADGKQMLDVFVANIRQGGAASKAIQESFGMKRVGR